MLAKNDGPEKPRLHRALNLRDLVALNVACIVSLSSLAQVAQFGFGSLSLYLLAIALFLIPSGLMAAELNARMPEEGGFYLWTRRAFGDWHGYVAAWSYWLSNIVWLPTAIDAGLHIVSVRAGRRMARSGREPLVQRARLRGPSSGPPRR